MLKNKPKIIMILFLIILFLTTSFVLADNENSNVMPIAENSEENTTSPTSQEDNNYKKSDVYLVGDNVTIDYIVDGNLFVCANTVTINSSIGGDAFVLANKIIIESEGTIYSNLFATAPSIEVKGVVYDIYAASKDFTLNGGFIYRDIKTICENFNVYGGIGRNAFVNCSNISFQDNNNNTTGAISGDLNYTSNKEIEIPENSVKGQVYFSQSVTNNPNTIQNYLISLGSFLAFVLILWVLCYGFACQFLGNINELTAHKKGSIIIAGLVGLVMIPAIILLLFLMQITSSIAFLLLILYFILLAIAKSIFIIALNHFISSKLNINKNAGIFGMLILISLIIWGIGFIPYIGSILSVIMIVLGLGFIFTHILTKNFPNSKTSKEKETKTNEKKDNQ